MSTYNWTKLFLTAACEATVSDCVMLWHKTRKEVSQICIIMIHAVHPLLYLCRSAECNVCFLMGDSASC